jgi:hypothetical protein
MTVAATFRALALLTALAGCAPSPTAPFEDADAEAPGATNAQADVAAQCLYLSFSLQITAGPKSGLQLKGELDVAQARTTTDVSGVLMGPPVESGVEQRIPVSGQVTGKQITMNLLLSDATGIDLSGTIDAPFAACSGSMQGAVDDPETGTWTATGARPPPTDAVTCVLDGADPLVCAIYQ